MKVFILLIFIFNTTNFLFCSDNSKQYFRSKFSKLTSSVWRYKSSFKKNDLKPIANNNPHPEPIINRMKPERVTIGPLGKKLYITVAGSEGNPKNEVIIFDIASRKIVKTLKVGLRPYNVIIHPSKRFMLVTNELSNYISIIDIKSDRVSGYIPADYYCQGIVITKDGKKAYVANRYLDQVLVFDLSITQNTLQGKVKNIGGFNESEFFGLNSISHNERQFYLSRGYSEQEIQKALSTKIGGISSILKSRCAKCHQHTMGGYYAGADQIKNYLSAIEHSIGGDPKNSPLLKAVTAKHEGGYGDDKISPNFHSGGVLFEPNEIEYEKIYHWIKQAKQGPGIRVGNEMSHPKDLVLSSDEKQLFVGNTGTMDVSIIDTDKHELLGGIYIQNVTNHLNLFQKDNKDWLLILSMGIGFGATKSRDPLGAETWSRDNEAAQYTLLRDPITTDSLPLSQQDVMGPFDAVDGTWNIKMKDIQNDLVLINTSSLKYPKQFESLQSEYLLKANKYEAHQNWVRYTSDTAESTLGDVKGDIAPELQRVHGSFAEWSIIDKDKLYVSMAGSFEVVEYQINIDANDSSFYLSPIEKYDTGIRPMGLEFGKKNTLSQDLLFVVNQLSESLTIINRKSKVSETISLSDNLPYPVTDAELGELITHTSIFTSDGDTSCLHCHYRDAGDGRAWGAAESIGQDRFGHITAGGTLGIPQMKNLLHNQPFYFEGTHRISEGQGADINEPASSIDFVNEIWAGDFSNIKSPIPDHKRKEMHEELKERVEVRKLGKLWYDLEEKREEFLRTQSMKYLGESKSLSDLYRAVATWMGNEPHLFPNPFDQQHPSVKRGERLFNSANVMCGVCHVAPNFTNKDKILANNDRRALPSLTTITRRDASYTLAGVHAVDYANSKKFDMEPTDLGRTEDQEGTFTTMQLRGIFDRPPVFLHHGRARSLREAIATPKHQSLRKFVFPVLQGSENVRANRQEQGFNEITSRSKKGTLNVHDQIFDTHGGTSHLTVQQMNDLIHFMQSIH
ncbi:MAG: hypothetical protein KC646_00915 [Candidatus Cloacimonetes bacterium]|nr:hypothetical protein [Candidatus Cloacimonadota bacterium]